SKYANATMYVGTANGRRSAHDKMPRLGNWYAEISQALPTPRQLTRAPTPIRSIRVLLIVVGNTNLAKCSQCDVSPVKACQPKAATGATTLTAISNAPICQPRPESSLLVIEANFIYQFAG